MKIPRIVIAAPGSGSGKTVVTCALLESLRRRGLAPVSYKCGPDYIDPMFHTHLIGVPSRNLDLFFLPEEALRELFVSSIAEEHGQIAVVEGVMGLYDGLGGIGEEASTYHVAACLQAPIVLVVNVRGMGRSLLALLSGFLQYDTVHLIRGVILNQTSRSFYESMKPVIEETFPIKVLGYLSVEETLGLESRHLGLKLPQEIADLRGKLEKSAEILEECVDLEALWMIARDCEELPDAKADIYITNNVAKKHPCTQPILAVARDEAFCFYYEDNLRMLREAGLKLAFFSPLYDTALPDGAGGILLGGGYPELAAEKLSANVAMREAVREAIRQGMPSVAECGGFLYLQETLADIEGKQWPMVGAMCGEARKKDRLVRFGYVEIEEKHALFLPEGEKIRGHEFHYYDCSNNGADCVATKPVVQRAWDCIHAGETHWWGFPHLYYRSNPSFVEHFAQVIYQWQRA